MPQLGTFLGEAPGCCAAESKSEKNYLNEKSSANLGPSRIVGTRSRDDRQRHRVNRADAKRAILLGPAPYRAIGP